MTLFASIFVLAASLTTQDAILTLLNAPTACSRERYGQALEMVGREAANGKPLQQFVYGITMKEKDAALSKKLLAASRLKIQAMAEERESPLAIYLLSVADNDVEMLRKAARGGNVQALNALGTMMMEEATGRRKSDTNLVERAMRLSYGYFSKAAEQRDPNGFVNLGTCYLRGFGCDINLMMAFQCFRSAAELGHPEAMDNLSACYELGHGVAKDARLSLFWRMKARALRGDALAQKWLEEGK